MSTRCNIAFYQNRTDGNKSWSEIFYRHHDGYPDGENGVVATIMDDLVKIIKFNADPNLVAARFFVKQRDSGKELEKTTGIHGDIEYLYRINVDERELVAMNSKFQVFETYPIGEKSPYELAMNQIKSANDGEEFAAGVEDLVQVINKWDHLSRNAIIALLTEISTSVSKKF